ncbi:hypothetical protein [Streptomyces chattanoogensis]|uniref:hypothetical protein n=1 Tax=Streptomyces chattanoogensis TaxID=66876 RepID=UPI0036BAD91B
MTTSDAYVIEEQPDGTLREFWVNRRADEMHTMEITEGWGSGPDSIYLSWWSESTGLVDWDEHCLLVITKDDARRMVCVLQRLIDDQH